MGIILKATNLLVCCFFRNIYCKHQSLADEEVAEVDLEKLLNHQKLGFYANLFDKVVNQYII